jgi:hypothetical protein
VEKLYLELAFEGLDLLAQRGLADAQFFRRARDVAFFRDRDEIA